LSLTFSSKAINVRVSAAETRTLIAVLEKVRDKAQA